MFVLLSTSKGSNFSDSIMYKKCQFLKVSLLGMGVLGCLALLITIRSDSGFEWKY